MLLGFGHGAGLLRGHHLFLGGPQQDGAVEAAGPDFGGNLFGSRLATGGREHVYAGYGTQPCLAQGFGDGGFGGLAAVETERRRQDEHRARLDRTRAIGRIDKAGVVDCVDLGAAAGEQQHQTKPRKNASNHRRSPGREHSRGVP